MRTAGKKRFKSTVSRAVLLPYKLGSRSAKELANKLTNLLNLKVRRVRHEGAFRPKLRSLLINYGSSIRPQWPLQGRWLNAPDSCRRAGNKLSAFQAFLEAGLSIPDFTTDRDVAAQWVAGGAMVVCRTVLNGHSGRGIVIASSAEQLVNAPLYVKYKKKLKEYRVHVFQEKVIDVAEKRKRRDGVARDDVGLVRNVSNGWVFCRDGIVKPADLDELAVASCRALCLDFGAVDIIWNGKENKCYVLEVNTAPGLEGTTLTSYTNAIYSWIRSQV